MDPKQYWGVWTPNNRDEGQPERTRVSQRGVGEEEGKRERSGRVGRRVVEDEAVVEDQGCSES
jgi:hypothetical protein